jgi:hypothetical protein
MTLKVGLLRVKARTRILPYLASGLPLQSLPDAHKGRVA